MIEAHDYLLFATAYGLLGAALSCIYYFSPHLREEPLFHAATALLISCALTAILLVTSVTLGTSTDSQGAALLRLSPQFFLFFGASLAYAPVVVFLMLYYWELLIEKVTSPATRKSPPREPRSSREQEEQVEQNLAQLELDPHNPVIHERLGDLYARSGFLDSAVYEYMKAADWLGRGYMHGHMLYKAARILVERKRETTQALMLLRRIVRIYPKSYFAAYSRRILNQYEAHSSCDTQPPG